MCSGMFRRKKIRVVLFGLVGFTYLTEAQDPAKKLPQNYRIALENNLVQVVRVTYQPHEKLPLHDHSQRPTIYVYLTDSGPVRFSHVENPSFELTRRPLKAGEFRVSPGRLERHLVENLGDIRTEFLRVELKYVPLGLQDLQFRGNKKPDLTHTHITNEFSSPQVSVKRFVIAHEHETKALAAVAPVLLIAFSPVSIRSSTLAPKLLNGGELYWLDKNQVARLGSVDGGMAHVLAIALLNKTTPAAGDDVSAAGKH